MGTAKKLKIDRRFKTKSLIGTPHYMAPQIILGKGYSFQADKWSLGVVLYEMICAKLPFGELTEDPFTIYEEVMNHCIKFPRSCPKQAKLLIEKLLSKNPQQRLGCDFEQMKKHPFFLGITWAQILNKGAIPPYYPPDKASVT